MIPFAFILPVSFIPGIAILIVSTINKRSNIHEVLLQYRREEHPIPEGHFEIQEKRLLIIHRILTLLYLAVAFFSLASFLGGLTINTMELNEMIMFILLCIGILFITSAAFLLIYESHVATQSVRMERDLRKHFAQGKSREKANL